MDEILHRRRFCAALWLCVFGAAAAGAVIGDGRASLAAFGLAVLASLLTVVMAKPGHDERLMVPVGYRVATGAVLGAALAGAALALLPGACEASKVTGVFFGLAAVLAYRAVVARGPRAAVVAVIVAMWSWIPFAFVAFCGCRGGYRGAARWSEIASSVTLHAFLLLLPIAAAAALLAFAPRRDELPDARVLR